MRYNVYSPNHRHIGTIGAEHLDMVPPTCYVRLAVQQSAELAIDNRSDAPHQDGYDIYNRVGLAARARR
jgi:hypothetical protein